MKQIYPFILVLQISILAQDLTTLNVEGMDFFADSIEGYPHQVDQVRLQNGHLYLRNHIDKAIFISTPAGKIIQTVGQPGRGPGSFSSRLIAFNAYQDEVVVLARNGPYQLFTFKEGSYSSSFPVNFELFCTDPSSTNPLAVSKSHTVVPAHPKTGHLAFAYDRKGKQTPIGELLFDKRDGKQLQRNRCLNEILWVFNGDHLLGILKYQPIILEFDHEFKLVNSTTIENPRLMQLQERHNDLDISRFSTLPGLFFDLQIHGDSLFLMASQTLFEVDLTTFKIINAFCFRGVGKAFQGKDPSSRFHFPTFALAENGRDLYLGPARNLEADIIVTKLPLSPLSTEKGD